MYLLFYKKQWVVYIIKFKIKGEIRYYTGYSSRPKQRFREHREARGANILKYADKIFGMSLIDEYRQRKMAMKKEKEIKKMAKNNKKLLYEKGKKVNDF
ncbi:MAG: hypothetical protein GF329_01390 [Candidatus Lokiarchaeota archaeon]|nr:hypothetical protein [Candidatus Lokiarchaeota archaeon]